MAKTIQEIQAEIESLSKRIKQEKDNTKTVEQLHKLQIELKQEERQILKELNERGRK